jgi:hypothetical protein
MEEVEVGQKSVAEHRLTHSETRCVSSEEVPVPAAEVALYFVGQENLF